MNGSEEPVPAVGRRLLPHELFEFFLANTEMERICVESTHYTGLKGNHTFTMIVEKFGAFLTIHLVSGYAGLPRQEMYWERRKNCHNVVKLAMMTEIEFLECKRYFNI